MKILYDHQIFTRQDYGGISRYFCELLERFSRDADINFKIALRISYNENLRKRHSLDPYWSARSDFFANSEIIPIIQRKIHINLLKRLRINQYESVKLLKEQDLDIFHPTDYNPYFLKHLQKKPYVLTVHDMIHELYPNHFSRHDPTREWKKELIEKASAIIAVSQNTKKDILQITGIAPERIAVIYHGNPFEDIMKSVDADIYPYPRGTKKRYLLFVGTRTGYKNFIFFISSIAGLLKKEHDLHVCCAGGGAFSAYEQQILRNLGIDSKIHFIKPDDRIMPQLYADAQAFVFPSLYEGFGLPLLEAFSCGCPVIASGNGSIPEIGGNAALYFDPGDSGSLLQAIEAVLTDDQHREYLIRKGRERIKEYSWNTTAQKTKKVYESLKADNI